MADSALPTFRYHPDPVATGSIGPAITTCIVCGEARGWIYTGPVFSEEEYVEEICPWCLASGAAARSLDAEFTDTGFGVPDDVPANVTTTIATETPGFAGWQQEYWLYHCGDGAAFLGRVGSAELHDHPDAMDMVMQEKIGYWTPDQAREYVETLSADGDATAYLFRCLHCDRYLAYSDMT